MAIIQISRIQHRRGLSTDLPQLASAELGWSIDTRQLYIGNGTISEGAPTVGNTEILTEYSDILSVAQTYTYKGLSGGYVVQTGPSVSAPVSRTLQSKLDDIVNARDFGAVGDGITNDLPALNRALNQLFCQSSNTLARRVLYIPGGTYKLAGGTLNIPTNASIIGDGPGKTILIQSDVAQQSVAKTADSKQQIDSNIGQSGATLPQFISIAQLSLINQTNNDVLRIRTTTGLTCQNVLFTGSVVTPTSVGSSKSCVVIESINSPSVIPTNNILFDHCGFTNNSYGLLIDNPNIYDVVFSSCGFQQLYQGAKLGELTAVDPRPTAIKFVNSFFDKVSSSAINTFASVSGIISAHNHFRDVGNTLNGAGNPTAPVISFAADDNFSVGDQFDRPTADIITYPIIERGTGTSGPQGLAQGRQTLGTGRTATLGNNTSGIIASTFDATSAVIEYSITRSSAYRTGVIKVSSNGTTAYYDDEYQGSTCGVTLSVSASAGTNSISYVADNSGGNATFLYSIKYFS